ncbi:MAG: hypothetical protein AB1696_04090 [Planctomycetota bacterium]
MSAKNSKKKSRTDWDRLRKMRDENIDLSDIPALDKKLFRKAKLRAPSKETASPSSRRLSLKRLLAKVTNDNIHKEVKTGRRQGRENW